MYSKPPLGGRSVLFLSFWLEVNFMQKYTSKIAVLVALVFLLVSAAIALPGTLASEAYVPAGYTEFVIEPGGGKVVPPNWCLEHGYIPLFNPDNPYHCIRCD